MGYGGRRRRRQHRSNRRMKEMIMYYGLPQNVAPGSLTTRLFSDAVVKCFDFGVDDPKSAFAAHTILAGCGGLAGRYCFNELGDDDAAFIDRRMVHTVLRRSRTSNVGSAQC